MTSPAADPALEAALEALFATPFPDFVEERKRLVVGLRASGHKAAAAALAKVNRPTLASWAINQLVRRAPGEVSAMFATAARVRLGDFSATGEHRQTIARLSALATDLLREHELPTSEATLRRITTSLQALSAYGDFAPELPGRMIADRDPPGFDSMGLADGSAGATLPFSLGAQTLRVVPAPAATPAPSPPATPAPTATPAPAPLKPTAEKPVTKAAILAARAAAKDAASSSKLLAQLAASAGLPPKSEQESAPAPAPPEAAPHRSAAPVLRLVPLPAPEEASSPDDAAATKAAADAAAAEAAADAEAAAAAEAAERAVAEAAAALAAAQAAAKAAAARVHLARQRAVLEDLRTRQRRAASAIFDHEQAIALMQRELEQRQNLLRTARHDAEALQADIERLTAELAALEPPR